MKFHSMPSSKYALVIFIILAIGLLVAIVGSAMQSLLTIPTSGTVRSSSSGSSGSILYMESFETATLGRFGWSYGTGPNGWNPDVSDEFSAYGEVVNTIAQDGNQAVQMNAPKNTGGTVYANLGRAMTSSGNLGYSQFYVSWYERFASLPNANQYMLIEHMTHAGWTTSTGHVNIARNGAGQLIVGLADLWINGQQVGSGDVSYNFVTGAWYKFEVYYKYGVTDGEYRLWINDQEIITVTGKDTTPVINGVKQTDPYPYLPIDAAFGVTNWDTTQGITVYIDNIIFANGKRDVALAGILYQTGFETNEDVTTFPYYGPHRGGLLNTSSTFSRTGLQSAHAQGLRDWYWVTDTLIPYWGSGVTIPVGQDYAYATAQSLGANAADFLNSYHFRGDSLEKLSDGTYKLWVTMPRSRIMLPESWGMALPLQVNEVYSRVYFFYVNRDGPTSPMQLDGWRKDPVNTALNPASYSYECTVDIGGNASNSISVYMGMNQNGGTSNPLLAMTDWAPRLSDGSIWRGQENIPIPPGLTTLNAWHSLEVRFVRSRWTSIIGPDSMGLSRYLGEFNGGMEVWIDGVKVFSKMDIDTSDAPYPTGIATGIVYMSSANNGVEVYVDDWVVSMFPIGP